MTGSIQTSKRRRQQAIRDLLARNEIRTQEQLEALLEVEGISVAQATLSRDLRELGAAKSTSGYQLDVPERRRVDDRSGLGRALCGRVESVESGGSVLVIRTRPGTARLVAAAVDRAGLDHVLGTVAGVDTVLVVARSTTHAGELRWQLRRLARG